MSDLRQQYDTGILLMLFDYFYSLQYIGGGRKVIKNKEYDLKNYFIFYSQRFSVFNVYHI